jgi:hypothetical protein
MILENCKIFLEQLSGIRCDEESKASVNHHERLRIVTKVQQPVAALLHLSISSVVRKIFFVQYMEGQMISRTCLGNDDVAVSSSFIFISQSFFQLDHLQQQLVKAWLAVHRT